MKIYGYLTVLLALLGMALGKCEIIEKNVKSFNDAYMNSFNSANPNPEPNPEPMPQGGGGGGGGGWFGGGGGGGGGGK